MKFCSHCGGELRDESVVCPKCGSAVDAALVVGNKPSGLQLAAKIFMIMGCIANAGLGFVSTGIFGIISLCWTVPMTIHYFHATRAGRPVGVGFKVCSLLFVNLIAGILMLCDNGNNR